MDIFSKMNTDHELKLNRKPARLSHNHAAGMIWLMENRPETATHAHEKFLLMAKQHDVPRNIIEQFAPKAGKLDSIGKRKTLNFWMCRDWREKFYYAHMFQSLSNSFDNDFLIRRPALEISREIMNTHFDDMCPQRGIAPLLRSVAYTYSAVIFLGLVSSSFGMFGNSLAAHNIPPVKAYLPERIEEVMDKHGLTASSR